MQSINLVKKSHQRSILFQINHLSNVWLLFLLSIFISSCSIINSKDGPPSKKITKLPDDPVPYPEPRSKHGNAPSYEVLGKHYKVLESSHGYVERGVASWYGKKFHGRMTSNRENYDMYAMTAAHKTLPLPTYVEVRNLKNRKKVIVRVNDRGPFVEHRIIDLSYSAALKLDIIDEGTGFVEIKAVNFDKQRKKINKTKINSSNTSNLNAYLQVGAFKNKKNARSSQAILLSHGIKDAFIHKKSIWPIGFYRVRIGPIKTVQRHDEIMAQLQRIGIVDIHIVTE